MQLNKQYAEILKSQGFFDEAFSIFKKFLKDDPNNREVKLHLRQIKKMRLKFKGVDESKKNFFINMKTDEEFQKFEEWLIG
jgi:tetratricopeptide (TPR) repeat protein